MLRFCKIKVAKEETYDTKKPIKISDLNVHNRVISKLVETKNNSQYLVGYLHEVIRPLHFVLPKMSGYVKTR